MLRLAQLSLVGALSLATTGTLGQMMGGGGGMPPVRPLPTAEPPPARARAASARSSN